MFNLPKVPTGIPGLDAMLGGGLAPGSFCILDGDPMSAAHLLALDYASAGLKAGEGCVYFCSKEFGDNIMTEIGSSGAQLGNGMLSVVDAYTALADPQVKDTDAVQYVSSVSDLPKLNHLIVSAMSKLFSNGVVQQRLVIESVDTMIMYLPVQAIYRFLFFVKAKVHSFKGVGLVLFSSDRCSESERKMLLELADVIVRMESSSNSIKVFVPSKATATGRYTSTDGALEITPHGVMKR